jgi:hypothetical protein
MATDERDPALEPPPISVADGYVARLLVERGVLWDPLVAVAGDADDEVWVSDDGGELGEGQGNVYRVAFDGRVSPLGVAGTMTAPIGIDRAPEGFGPYAGQVFGISQADTGSEGARQNHVVVRLDPATGTVEHFAELRLTGPDGATANTGGVGARFGPPGTAFAGSLFTVTVGNGAIQEVKADGSSRPFALLAPPGPSQPMWLTFDQVNGEDRLLVTTPNGNIYAEGSDGTVTAIAPDGTVLAEPYARGLVTPMGIDRAPRDWGRWGGRMVVADLGGPIQLSPPPERMGDHRGRVVVLDDDGEVHTLVSGLLTPHGIRFVGRRLIVCDIGFDFSVGAEDAADGFVVEIVPDDRR